MVVCPKPAQATKKVVLVCPSGTVTEETSSLPALGLLLDKSTTVPPAGAGAESDTVHVVTCHGISFCTPDNAATVGPLKLMGHVLLESTPLAATCTLYVPSGMLAGAVNVQLP